jgi:hypothetical protein
MKNLKCTTSSCEHNLKNQCLAGVITVGETAKCLSKIKREGGALAQAFADIEAAEELDFRVSSGNIVQCDATNCKHNLNNICSADEILVDDTILSTKCKTRDVKKKGE